MIELYTKVGNRVLRHEESPFFKFPDGEWDMKVEPSTYTAKEIAWVSGTNTNDYIKLALWADTVRKQNGKPYAVIPYLPAARADHPPTYAVEGAKIYAQLIGLADVESFTVADPHSQFIVDEIHQMTGRYVNSWYPESILDAETVSKYAGVIAPDKGAVGRVSAVALEFDRPLFRANKKRDQTTGNLSGFELLEDLPNPGGRYLIVDDICTGGGTFIGLAEAIRKVRPSVKLDLYVTHGSFTKGTTALREYFDKIITTNSLGEADVYATSPHVQIIDLKKLLLGSI